MQKSTSALLVIIIVALLVAGCGYFGYKYYSEIKNPVFCTMEAKLCPDGSYVGRTGPKCEFAPCPQSNSIAYKNETYGFELTLPKSWQGYSVLEQTWQGTEIDTGEQKYSGPEIIIKNPKTTPQQAWQDIPVMVFTPQVWKMVSGPNATVAVSAAPIGPAKIGENSKYIFATPPRWYGFTDAIGWEEAVEIVKTFKAY